jgi:hypothetical protein
MEEWLAFQAAIGRLESRRVISAIRLNASVSCQVRSLQVVQESALGLTMVTIGEMARVGQYR